MTCDRRRRLLAPILACAALAAAMLALSHAVAADSAAPVTLKPVPAGERVDYNRDIQPILSDRCYFCHGPDAAKRKAKLRLDTQEGALAKHDDGAAVVPGQPDKSELVRRITTKDPDDQMPPPESHRTLS